jgi:hypothetical protein
VDVALLTRTPQDRRLRPLPFIPVTVLLPDDKVHVQAKNRSDGQVDVNLLYIGADWSSSHWFSGRLQPRDELKMGLFKMSADPLRQERLPVVVIPARPDSPVEDLSYLAQDAVDPNCALSASAFSASLAEAGFGSAARGAIASTGDRTRDGPSPAILQLDLRTRAADQQP